MKADFGVLPLPLPHSPLHGPRSDPPKCSFGISCLQAGPKHKPWEAKSVRVHYLSKGEGETLDLGASKVTFTSCTTRRG